MGGLLAIFWRPSALVHGGVRRHGRIFDVVGLIALAAIVLSFVNVSDTSEALYRGGFLGLAVVSALAVAAASHPGTAFGRVLGVGVLTWIGLRSYALYLWHWPIYVVTRPDADVPLHGPALLALRLGLTVLLADLSYRLVERPIRRLGWGRWVRRTIRIGPPGRRRPVGLVVLGATVASLVAVVAVMRAGRPPASEIELSLQAGQEAIAAADATTAAPAGVARRCNPRAGRLGGCARPRRGRFQSRGHVAAGLVPTGLLHDRAARGDDHGGAHDRCDDRSADHGATDHGAADHARATPRRAHRGAR
jgi:hypothetical protein